jgi:hypothetical protein
MSDPVSSPGQTASSASSQAQAHGALFAQLVMQQANMALMLLGHVAHPETGKVVKDVDAAKVFIDQLEMLEVKTKGNLSKEEEALLKQSLMTLRLTFVNAVQSPSNTPVVTPPTPGATESDRSSEPAPGAGTSTAAPPEEHRTKFSKKY